MINKVILIGNLGKDAELKSMSNGGQFLTFSLATTETYKDKNSGENKKITQWHNVTLFGTLGTKLVDYLTSGTMIYVEGKINYNQYEDKNGQKQYRTSIIANEIKLLRTNANARPQDANAAPTPAPRQSSFPNENDGKPEVPMSHFFPDEIPF